MIVDDSNVMRKTLELSLKGLNLNIVAMAANGKSAVELFTKHLPDIVTLDITMPEMNGLEALDHMLSIKRETVIIIISALSDKSSVLQAMTKGAKTYLNKPISREKLEAVLLKYVGVVHD